MKPENAEKYQRVQVNDYPGVWKILEIDPDPQELEDRYAGWEKEDKTLTFSQGKPEYNPKVSMFESRKMKMPPQRPRVLLGAGSNWLSIPISEVSPVDER